MQIEKKAYCVSTNTDWTSAIEVINAEIVPISSSKGVRVHKDKKEHETTEFKTPDPSTFYGAMRLQRKLDAYLVSDAQKKFGTLKIDFQKKQIELPKNYPGMKDHSEDLHYPLLEHADISDDNKKQFEKWKAEYKENDCFGCIVSSFYLVTLPF